MTRADHAAAADAFIERRPEVWALFGEIALDLARRGHRRCSSDALMHLLRWRLVDRALEHGDRLPRLNNVWSARFARRWLEENPEHPGFFELRGEDDARAATPQMELGL